MMKNVSMVVNSNGTVTFECECNAPKRAMDRLCHDCQQDVGTVFKHVMKGGIDEITQ